MTRPTLFFDLDGTLTDPQEGITNCIRYALAKLNQPVPEPGELLWCIGPPLRESFDALVGVADAEQAVAHYRERFSTVGWLENRPYDGIHSLLARLHRKGYALNVATSKPLVYAERILAHFKLNPFFNHCFGAELDGTRSNKADLLNHACQILGDVDRAGMIGDRSHDMVGALANGITGIGVTYGYGTAEELRTAGARALAAHPDALYDIVSEVL